MKQEIHWEAICIETKICEICGIEFVPKSAIQKYCPECGKNPERVRRKYETAVRQSKIHAGDLYKPIEKECIVCGKGFVTTYESRRFCSDTCQHQYAVNTAVCPVCGTKLIERGNLTGKGYCSEKCREEARIQRAIRDGRYVDCEHCGKKFIRSSGRSRFCSKACFESYQAERRSASVLKEGSCTLRKRETERTCPICGKIFPINPQQYAKRFCSIECRAKSSSASKKKPEKAQQGHLCSSCRISQLNCERFTSGFKKFPQGAKIQIENGQSIVSECPKYTA